MLNELRILCTVWEARHGLWRSTFLPWRRIVKLIVPQLTNRFPALNGTRRVIKVFTKARQLVFEPDHSISRPSCFGKISCIVILPFTHVSSKLFLLFWLSHQNPVCTLLRHHICYMCGQSHPLDLFTLIFG